MPIDPRISLGVQPLQVADPVAQYGQVQNILAAQDQRRAAGTQNELAQAQLGQVEMSIREAQEAQDYVAQVMNAAKKNGAATDDPMDAAMQMLNHPNAKVRAAGQSLFDANEKVLAYKQQATFLKDQAPAPVAAQPDTENKLAPAPATPVNAMAAPANPKQQLSSKINDGDRKYGNAPGWLRQRELLVEEYKRVVDPRHATFSAINPKDYTPESIAKFSASQNYADLVPKVDIKNTNLGNVNPADYTPDSVQKFATSGNYADLVLKPSKADNVIASVTPSDYTPESLAKFATSKDYADLVLKPTKADKSVSNINPDSYTPESVAKFVTSNNYADLVLRTPKESKTIGTINPNDFTPTSIAKFNTSGNYADLVPKPQASSATPAAPVAVVGADGKVKYVSREEAISKGMTPANAMEGLAPKEIQAREAKFPAATSAVKTFESSTDRLVADLERLAKHPGLSGISGLIYGRTPALTKDARAAQALFDSIVARGGFQELQNMRASSPTGGALGNVSDREGQYLRDAFAPISRTQDTAELSRALTNAASTAKVAKQRVRESYDLTYDYKNQGKAPAGAVDTSNPLLKGK